jgi:hypothetical protein
MTRELTSDELRAEVAAIREGLQERALDRRMAVLEQRIRQTMIALRVARMDLRTPRRRLE